MSQMDDASFMNEIEIFHATPTDVSNKHRGIHLTIMSATVRRSGRRSWTNVVSVGAYQFLNNVLDYIE